jgi:hypothetical protein
MGSKPVQQRHRGAARARRPRADIGAAHARGVSLAAVAALSWFATPTRAQNVTVPAALAGVEGTGGSNIPFGSNQACRFQCIYDAEELPWSGPRVITGILLRADNSLPNTASAAKGWLDVSVLMSTTDRTAATASAVFADNRGTDATWVLQNQLIQLPAQPALPPGPRPANVPFVFQVPWAYALTPATPSMPAPRNLLVEIWVHSQPSGTYRVDNLGTCTATQSTFGNLGPACAVPGNAPLALTGDASMLAGSSFAWHVANGAPTMPFLVVLAASNVGGLFGNPAWPLPYPMFDPTNPTLPSQALALLQWPAPDCWLNVDPLVALGGITDAAGAGSATGMLPPGRHLVGQTFHAQALAMAPTANPLRFVTSLGLASTVCGPLGVARVHAFYNNAATPPPAPPASGTVQFGAALVFDVM